MEILFLKDHGDFHCGCRAVAGFIRSEFSRLGDVVDVSDNPGLIVMNGEGSFHHNNGRRYLEMLDRYPDTPKVLINTIWQECDDLVSYLCQFDYINVRERLSHDELRRHGFESEVFLDFSYYADAHLERCNRFKNQIVMGDHFLAFDGRGFEYHKLSFLKHPTWASFLSRVRGARLYITGYHHAIYACCRVRTPFVPYRHNSHKIQGLFDMAGVNIPIPETPEQVRETINWAMDNTREYERLFDFMEHYPRWSVKEVQVCL